VTKPSETPSGRMSANVSNPNLQNLPIRTEEGRRIRELFFQSRVTNTKRGEHRREEEP
jgi:DNA polymerase I-like protein with 3'-5' exonuclease and polymerase domains